MLTRYIINGGACGGAKVCVNPWVENKCVDFPQGCDQFLPCAIEAAQNGRCPIPMEDVLLPPLPSPSPSFMPAPIPSPLSVVNAPPVILPTARKYLPVYYSYGY